MKVLNFISIILVGSSAMSYTRDMCPAFYGARPMLNPVSNTLFWPKYKQLEWYDLKVSDGQGGSVTYRRWRHAWPTRALGLDEAQTAAFFRGEYEIPLAGNSRANLSQPKLYSAIENTPSEYMGRGRTTADLVTNKGVLLPIELGGVHLRDGHVLRNGDVTITPFDVTNQETSRLVRADINRKLPIGNRTYLLEERDRKKFLVDMAKGDYFYNFYYLIMSSKSTGRHVIPLFEYKTESPWMKGVQNSRSFPMEVSIFNRLPSVQLRLRINPDNFGLEIVLPGRGLRYPITRSAIETQKFLNDYFPNERGMQ